MTQVFPHGDTVDILSRSKRQWGAAMDGDQLAVEYEQIRQQIKHALSEAVRDMGAVCQAMDRLDEVQRHFKAERQLHESVSDSD